MAYPELKYVEHRERNQTLKLLLVTEKMIAQNGFKKTDEIAVAIRCSKALSKTERAGACNADKCGLLADDG